jgi:hypothetical protein
MLHAKPFQTGLVLLQPAYGFLAFHRENIANPGFHSTAIGALGALASAPGSELANRPE